MKNDFNSELLGGLEASLREISGENEVLEILFFDEKGSITKRVST